MALSMPIAPAALSSRVQTGIASFRAPVAARPAKVSAKSRRAAVIVKAAAEPT